MVYLHAVRYVLRYREATIHDTLGYDTITIRFLIAKERFVLLFEKKIHDIGLPLNKFILELQFLFCCHVSDTKLTLTQRCRTQIYKFQT